MKTTTGNLFNNTGILSHAGTYAGEYMQEAWDILDKAYTLPEFQGHMWADIMHNNDGPGMQVVFIWRLAGQIVQHHMITRKHT